jgi:hypothetical protein
VFALAFAVVLSAALWLLAPEHVGISPPARFELRTVPTVATSAASRDDAFVRAAMRLPGDYSPFHRPPAVDTKKYEPLTCALLSEPPSGTSPKFTCSTAGGEILKVKYGRNPEIPAEAAATRLLTTLGYAADVVTIAPRLRCYGCPRYPFLAAQLRGFPLIPRLLPARYDGGYTDFSMVAVERRFPAPAIQSDRSRGWAWWELKNSSADRADVDALRLLALFLAHWDNKAENQRLVCLDPPPEESAALECERPLLMLQDVGGTFGPYKMNIAAWPNAPIWDNPAACTATMRTLPFGGGTFPDVQISEAGRRKLLDQLTAFTASDIRTLFSNARFQDYYSGTDDERDLAQWSAAFRHRVRILSDAGPCPPVS